MGPGKGGPAEIRLIRPTAPWKPNSLRIGRKLQGCPKILAQHLKHLWDGIPLPGLSNSIFRRHFGHLSACTRAPEGGANRSAAGASRSLFSFQTLSTSFQPTGEFSIPDGIFRDPIRGLQSWPLISICRETDTRNAMRRLNELSAICLLWWGPNGQS